MEQLFEKLKDILEVDSVVMEDKLEDFDAWDSLSVLSIIALLDSDYGIRVTANQLEEFERIKDIVDYIDKKSESKV
jgi:acyl carrier protein